MSWSLIAHVSFSGNLIGGTSASIDTTGADLIVITTQGYSPEYIGNLVLSDNKSNTWINQSTQDGSIASASVWYSQSPTVGPGHTFTFLGPDASYPGFQAAVFSGSAASPVDQTSKNYNGSATTIQPGLITPSENNELIIVTSGNYFTTTAPTVDSGFTVTDNTPTLSGETIGGVLAYLFQGSAAAVNPTISWDGSSNDVSTVITSFKGAAPRAFTLNQTILEFGGTITFGALGSFVLNSTISNFAANATFGVVGSLGLNSTIDNFSGTITFVEEASELNFVLNSVIEPVLGNITFQKVQVATEGDVASWWWQQYIAQQQQIKFQQDAERLVEGAIVLPVAEGHGEFEYKDKIKEIINKKVKNQKKIKTIEIIRVVQVGSFQCSQVDGCGYVIQAIKSSHAPIQSFEAESNISSIGIFNGKIEFKKIEVESQSSYCRIINGSVCKNILNSTNNISNVFMVGVKRYVSNYPTLIGKVQVPPLNCEGIGVLNRFEIKNIMNVCIESSILGFCFNELNMKSKSIFVNKIENKNKKYHSIQLEGKSESIFVHGMSIRVKSKLSVVIDNKMDLVERNVINTTIIHGRVGLICGQIQTNKIGNGTICLSSNTSLKFANHNNAIGLINGQIKFGSFSGNGLLDYVVNDNDDMLTASLMLLVA